MEIRGAGELLGAEQSGQIHQVGFSLYLSMLESAVAALRRGDIPDIDQPLDTGTEVKLHVPALIPDDYLPDISTRLVLYKRIAQAQSAENLRDIQVEMIDRFGLLPEPVKTVIAEIETVSAIVMQAWDSASAVVRSGGVSRKRTRSR